MDRNKAFLAAGALSLLLAGCASAAPALSERTVSQTPSPGVSYFAGTYECAVSGGSGFEIDDLLPGGAHDYSSGGALIVGADGTWKTPTSAGTWVLRGATITISVNEARGIRSVDVPGFPTTSEAATSGSTLVISHPTYSGDRTVIGARMTGGGFQLTNEKGAVLNCARG